MKMKQTIRKSYQLRTTSYLIMITRSAWVKSSQNVSPVSVPVLCCKCAVCSRCSVKSRATRLCSESESGLRNILQDPLLVFAQWSHMVFQVLENSAEVTDFSNNTMMVQNIEAVITNRTMRSKSNRQTHQS
ncbi:hypothetical protein F7725_007534 [Dissostichus mawsoni]|uniref:Uncharacterized protein n=1 Tax=Dissostichus mawsoni TaxID=36200 RepID=A0A7J5Y5S7_DISMA|nr:hypothetical protein F7725_007534 [Dissostichus mawsoni]